MSDHVDGPRTMADPSIDLTDIYAFTSPENPHRTVVIVNVFPGAGDSAWFSNAAYYSAVLKRVRIDGKGINAAFTAYDDEIRFQFKFDRLSRTKGSDRPFQAGKCTLPSGETIQLIVGDINGSSTKDNKVRVFAGLRSDPFFIGWYNLPTLQGGSNLTQDDNVLGMVVDFDTDALLNTKKGSLFGVIGESTPVDKTPTLNNIPRYDWAGRPELANYLITIPGDVNLLDLWNQQTPFDVDPAVIPLYRERLKKHFHLWDMKDGKKDWPDDELNANVNIFINDFLLIDVSKPINDHSNLEIEKSVLNNREHQTGGGRTLDSNAVDILLTWMINRDHGPFLQSPAIQATKKSDKTFPYLASPNATLLTIQRTLKLSTPSIDVWKIVGKFDHPWSPLVIETKIIGDGSNRLRVIRLVDGKTITERLIEENQEKGLLKYQLVSGISANPLNNEIAVIPTPSGTDINWTIRYLPDGQGELFVGLMLNTWIDVGMTALKKHFNEI